jgi:DNA polymerase-3 subunit delta'
LVVHTGTSVGLVNQDMTEQFRQLARVLSPEQLLGCMDAIGTARERIDANVQTLLALEAMAISLQLPR